MAGPQIGFHYRVLALNLSACYNYASHYSKTLVDHHRDDENENENDENGRDKIFCLINPVITWKSHETRTLWDDCLSIPDTMVRVRRHERVQVEWTRLPEIGIGAMATTTPERITWKPDQLHFDLSELLQHEIDHLEGTLATDLVEEYDHPASSSSSSSSSSAYNREEHEKHYPSIISRTEFLRNIEHYKTYVDDIII